MGPRKLWWMNRRFIESIKDAEFLQRLLADLFPKVERFKSWICDKAHEQQYLINAWGVIQHFYDVYQAHYNKRYNTWEKLNGSEHEQAIACLVQGDAHGMVKDKMKTLEIQGVNEEHSFVNTVHDSLMFIPELGKRDKCIEAVYSVMSAPCKRLDGPSCPNGLVVGVDVTWGKVWRKYDRERNPDGMREVTI